MIDTSDVNFWNEKFEDKKMYKFNASDRIINIGLLLFGIGTVINMVLIYIFFNMVNKL